MYQYAKDKGHDKYGSWNYIELKGKKDRIICIINTYVPFQNMSCGTITYAAQLIRNRPSSYHANPLRKWFFEDLKTFIEKIQSMSRIIIIGIDANSPFNIRESDIYSLKNQLNLIDIVPHFNPSQNNTPTCRSGQNRIYSILISTQIVRSSIRGEIFPRDKFTTSDHNPIFVDFHIP